ncbi:MAG: DUF3703 domain-containing protein [Xanthomonadales bacterium]|jgi:hypothetical protein|nr:DUF3703 domain-containing protein [Xanthomonadales bacterium]
MRMTLREAFELEWKMAEQARRFGDFDVAFRHLERAHIIGQRRTRLHMQSHLGMLRVAWQRRDLRELVGQITRTVAAALFSRLWVPVGNTGGSNVSPFRSMPVPSDLQCYAIDPDGSD